MGREIEYNGKIYYRNNAKWVDGDSMVVPMHLQHVLNTLVFEEKDLMHMSYEQAKAEGDRAKRSESYSLAIKYYEQALREANSLNGSSVLLPRISSCYRKIGKPQKVIELLCDMKQLYGEKIINEALLTSAAAAYCDMEDAENALRCCKWAFRILKSKTNEPSLELSNVFSRAKKMLDPDYSLDEKEYWR